MRNCLKTGTLIKVPGDIIYKITGEPIGEGGGGIIYPAIRMLPDSGGYKTSHILYAVKECYPQSDRFQFSRNKSGEICAPPGDLEAEAYLAKAKEMQEQEESVSGSIYAHAFRLTPILESYQQVELSFDDGATSAPVHNLISVMESLSGKGESLKHSLAEKKHLTVRETFDVIRQVLYAVGEVHKSGFLHLDIQDGNVFIKGVLDKNDRMISMIDFGSARPVLDDGKCAEITDKVLYSTQGFTAPEIIRGNNGHLRLGKQTDIFSIGVLALLLLTGHRYTTTELMANKSEKYIPRFAMRKTNCPAHLTERMQGIITKALKTDSTMRYESCDEMLEDVNELLALLAPHADPLSATDYDAFICYKHSDRDNAAARTLRDSLERYKDSFYSKRRINRVFLDEGELSSCSDFGERINTALKKSRWLIVLCSEQTRQSAWVNEEIRSFLKYHDKSHLLTVITEGEPDEVYPDELIRNGLSAKNLFAADARADSEAEVLKKIKGDVCLQIAAPILETTFDALKQRTRIYRIQRTFAAVAVTLCVMLAFIGYAAIKNYQIANQADMIIKEQHAKILSQAELLAEQAQGAYDSKDYSNAMKLALSSMEASDEDEDQQSELKSILISCLNLYVRPEEASSLPVPTGVFSMEGNADIAGCFLNHDGSRLFVISDKSLTVWDARDCSVLFSFDENDEIEAELYTDWENCLIEDRSSFLICSGNRITALSYETGRTLWTREFSDESYQAEKVILSKDQKCLYRISYSFGEGTAAIDELDPLTGDTEKTHVFPGNYQSAFGNACAVSPDGRYIASIGMSGSSEKMNEKLYVFDLESDAAISKKLGEIDPWGTDATAWISFANDSRIIASRYDGPVNVRSALDAEHSEDLVGGKKYRLSSYDLSNRSIIWQYDTEDETAPLDLRGLRIPQICLSQIDDRSVIVAGVGNTMLVFSEEDGSKMKEIQLDACVLSLNDVKDEFRLILENGDLVIIPKDLDVKNIRKIACFPESTDSALYQDDRYFIITEKDPNEIIRYEPDKYDQSYTETFMEGWTAADYIEELPKDDSILESDSIRLKLNDDKNSFKILSGNEKEISIGEEIRTLSLTPDSHRIFVGLKKQVLIYDTEGKRIAETDLPKELYSSNRSNSLYFPESSTCFYGDMNSGFLLDLNKNSIKIIAYMKNVVGYDHSDNSFIICRYLEHEDGGCTVGRVKYHSRDEIKETAAHAVN